MKSRFLKIKLLLVMMMKQVNAERQRFYVQNKNLKLFLLYLLFSQCFFDVNFTRLAHLIRSNEVQSQLMTNKKKKECFSC